MHRGGGEWPGPPTAMQAKTTVWANDLFLDRLWVFDRDPATGTLGRGRSGHFPAGGSALYGQSLMEQSGLQESDFTAHG